MNYFFIWKYYRELYNKSNLVFYLKNMWNRIFSFLILVWVFAGAYGFYYYFFVINKWWLTLNSNVSSYSVTLYNSDLKTSFETQCENQMCELIDLAPFTYALTVTKDWYESFQTEVKVIKKETQTLDISLQKSVYLLPQTSTQNLSSTGSQKIESLKILTQLKQKEKYFETIEKWNFYLEKNTDASYNLFSNISNPKNIFRIPSSLLSSIEIFEVFWDSKIIVSYDETYVLIDILTWESEQIDFAQDLKYAKKDGNILSLINDKWVFLYDVITQKTEYFYLFKDFVYVSPTQYLWVIFADETQKKKNFWYESETQNIFVLYDFTTQEKNIVYRTSQKIEKLLFEQSNIYFYNEKWEKFLIENIIQ